MVAPWISGADGDQFPIYDRVPTKFDGAMALGRILVEESLISLISSAEALPRRCGAGQ